MILAFIVPMFAIPIKAQTTYPTNATYPFVDCIPNTVGVNQRTLINFGLLNFLNIDGDGWNVSVIVTKPDGANETIGPLKTWSTGTVGYSYIPDQVGTYYLQTIFNGEVYRNVSYLPSKSDRIVLTVQNDPVPVYAGHALPSEYWSRPVDPQLREWFSIAGSWVRVPPNLYAPYNAGPQSAHILWTKPIGDTQGGLVGGDIGDRDMGTGDAYEGKWVNSLIVNGILFYNKFESGQPSQQLVATDLHTGKELWTKTFLNNQRVTFAQILYWDCLNYRGAFSYLWVSTAVSGNTTWSAFEPLSGEWRYNMTGVPSGTSYWGPNGEIVKYQIVNYGTAANPNYRLLRWNSSWVVNNGKVGMAESFGSQVKGVIYDAASRGYDMNVSIPFYNSLPAGSPMPNNTTINMAFVGDRIILSRFSYSAVNIWAFSVNPSNAGTLLFNNQWTPPTEWAAGNITLSNIGQAGWAAWSQADMVAVYFTKENRVHYAFDLNSGKFLWQTAPQIYADAWSDTVTSFGPDRVIVYGKLISATVGGIVYAYDIKTGKIAWQYNATDHFHEEYITNNWWTVPLFVTDGMIYIGHMEHSALNPLPRGAPFFALNATNGDLLWKIDGAFRQTRWGGRAIIGDSIIATQDTYDQRVYAIGKGPSTLTVTAPDTAAPYGTPVIIKGTVTDVSPGTQDAAVKLRFPNGVAAVSEESQSDWMLYVYKQFERPTNATGVPVSIDATDPNGNYIHIGDTTSDSTGTFSYMFTPQTAGKYTVYATFMGSKSYYGSFAQTAMGVQEAPAPTAAPTPTPKTVTEEYFVPAIAGIIAAIVLVGVVLAIITIRKHP
jgi:hypothetical protein